MVDFEKKDRYNFSDLVKIMEILRKNCPWDKEQTHDSIKANFIEETYEVIEAIENNDDDNLKEELGDVLLQVVFHTEMAQEGGRFDISDVTTGICEKLILRHPHIFGTESAGDADEVLDNWAKIKREQKKQGSSGEVMTNITKTLPSPMYAYKIQKEAAKAGFDFETDADAMAKLKEEVLELDEALSSGDEAKIASEGGDVMFACINILRRYKLDPELALMGTNKKFITRYLYIENQAKLRYNMPIEALTLGQMDKLWEEYKGMNA